VYLAAAGDRSIAAKYHICYRADARHPVGRPPVARLRALGSPPQVSALTFDSEHIPARVTWCIGPATPLVCFTAGHANTTKGIGSALN